MTSENNSFSKDAIQPAAKSNRCLQVSLWIRNLFVNGKSRLQNLAEISPERWIFAVLAAKSCSEEVFFNKTQGLIADIVGKEVTIELLNVLLGTDNSLR